MPELSGNPKIAGRLSNSHIPDSSVSDWMLLTSSTEHHTKPNVAAESNTYQCIKQTDWTLVLTELFCVSIELFEGKGNIFGESRDSAARWKYGISQKDPLGVRQSGRVLRLSYWNRVPSIWSAFSAERTLV